MLAPADHIDPFPPGARRPGALRTALGAAALTMLLFPRSLWRFSGLPSRLLPTHRGGPVAAFGIAVHLATYLGVGLPLTLVGVAEALITLNSLTLSEEYEGARLQSDFTEGIPAGPLKLPGPTSPAEPVRPYAPTDAFRDHLVRRYAPVVVQRVSRRPEWDVPVRIDFDGNPDPRDNVANEPRHRPHRAGIYGELTAETDDSFYLTYSFYHVKDYDHPVRELLSRWTHHDSDNEGFHIRVDKETMEIAEVETWFHNRFLLYNHTGVSRGTEPVHGRIYTEGGTHPIVYVQALGHGVRLLQQVDVETLDQNVKILRIRGERSPVPVRADREVQDDCTYELDDFGEWYADAGRPGTDAESDGLFAERISLGMGPDGEELSIGRFIAGLDYDMQSWSRPKPMWAWDDGWDDIPVAYWHFFPSRSFESHGGTALSHRYLYNAPADQIFGMTAAELFSRTDLDVERHNREKWDLHDHGLGNAHLRAAAWLKLKGYVNYLWHALG